ncbi:MAG TPA: uroporphyrinogen decarboxylase family protein [Armatimonadota bacterium]
MTSRERVLAALAHQPTDRAPANYHGKDTVTARLIEHEGVRDKAELLCLLGVDFRSVGCPYTLPNSEPDAEGYVRNMWGVRSHPEKSINDPSKTIYPFDEDSTLDDVLAHPWPTVPEDMDFSSLGPDCAKYADDYIVYGAPWSPFFHEVGWVLGQENFLISMHTNPEVVHAVLDAITSYELEASRRFFTACNGKLDIAYIGNDFGTQRGLFINPEQWNTFIRPPLKRFYDLAHDFGLKVMQHSCGAIRDVIPWLIADGVNILDPVQTRADGMALDGLMRDFGDRLSFHGGVDTQHRLPFGSVDDVRDEVRGYLALARAHGGYILNGSQEFTDDIPTENLLAMYAENK